METWWQDLRYAVRMILKKPGFTVVAVLSLALGIGANTAIFTVINAVFLHPLAFEDPSRVAEVFTHDTRTVQTGNFNLTFSSLPNYEDYRDQNSVFTGLAAFNPIGLQWTHNGETEALNNGMMVTANYFDVLGVKPYRGRFFSPDENIQKPAMVAVLSYGLWTNKFGADPGVIGQTLTLNGLPFTVIGVAQPGFKGTFALAGPEWVWVPIGMREQLATGQFRAFITNPRIARRFRWVGILGRMKLGVTLAQVKAELKGVASSLEKLYPDANLGRTAEVALVTDSALGINQRGQFVQAGGVLMGVVGLVLLIACVNLANLLLAQGAKREKEISIRAALGASRARLIRQLLIESVTLAILGGAFGLLVAYWGRNALWSFRPPQLGNANIDLSFDPRVLWFTVIISVLTGLLFGLVPALKLSRTNLNETLKAGGRSGALDLGHNRARSILVASEIGLATVALIGSALFVRSMQAAQKMDVGFDAQHIGFVGVTPGTQHYGQEQGEQFYLDAIQRTRTVPGIAGSAVASIVPLAGGNGVLLTTFPEGQAQGSSFKGSLIAYNDITPGYFETLRIPLRSGRDFNEFDRSQSTPVAIVNETVVRQLWPGQDGLHKRFTIVNDTTHYEVVGVVADSVIGAIGEDPTPMIYRPMRQEYAPLASLIVRTTGEPEKALGTVRDQVQTLDKNMPLRGTGTIRDQIDQGLWAPRMGAALLSIFGGLALALAMIGVYGVMSYSVGQRTQEIGIRMALGAQPGDVLQLVMRQGLLLALAGAASGIVAALLLARMVSGLLFGISGRDPVAYLFVSLALTVVALVACYIPARRATRVDPLIALRYE